MKKLIFYSVVALAVFLSGAGFLYSESTPKTVSGAVHEVRASERFLTVDVFNAATGITQMIQIEVDYETQYVHVMNLGNLSVGDSVVVDYMQGDRGKFLAKRLELTKHVSEDQSASKKRRNEPF